MSDNPYGVSVTLKAGKEFDAPWIVIHADSPTAALNQIDTGDFGALVERAVAASEFFIGTRNGKRGFPSASQQVTTEQPAQQQSPAPQPQAQAAPQQGGQGPAPTCKHGARTFKSGTGRNGREWKAWFCPAPKGAPDQCDPEWVK